ncbi:sucrose nonfermenting 4-like protein isoform X2 [Typha angustifolia]|uniref:sucrose nonfermenting 4-like protein isoform X2 n=1 Tax=Typha angustifolia TaxID=59011 RepID=UPI003C2E7398
MFSFGMDPSQDTSGAPGGALIPTRFVWPYGGRRVFLTGSFTRWSEHLPMSPVEGCPTVFQAICSLTPGSHQFKFYVDGEWKHDERQPYVSGNYGIVNTLLLTREPNSVPAILSPETTGNRMNMDVDSENFERVVTVSGGSLQETNLRISEGEMTISFQRISTFLSEHTAYELLPDSGKVIALDANMPVKQAFHILYEQGIPVAPLWDSYRGQFVGVLSALDFILILKELANHGSHLTEEELETHTISAWKEAKQQLSRQINPHGLAHHMNLIHAGPYDSLKDIAMKILQNEVATIPIIHSSHDGSFPQLLHLGTLSGILKCICRYFRHSYSSLPILQQPICNIPLGTWVPRIGEHGGRPLAMLRPNASLSAALSLLVQAQVSSIPIVDENDSLLDMYSRSDITALAKDRAYAQIHLDQISIHQALQLGQDANSPYGFFNGLRCQMCLRSDPLHKVMERLSNPGVRRLVIVEAGSKRVEGIISLSDVFRFLLGSPQAPASNV